MRRTSWAILALSAMLLVAGCGGGDDDGGGNAVKADWDLSSSHTMADVDWSDPGIDALNLLPIESVRLRFPDDSVFEATSGIQRIGLTRNGDQLDEVRLFADPMTVDDAYALAVKWAKHYDLPLAPLQKWHAAGGSVESRVVSYQPSGATLGDGGPQPTLEIIDSAVEDKPAQVVLNFGWA
jgi:hypothetical protein